MVHRDASSVLSRDKGFPKGGRIRGREAEGKREGLEGVMRPGFALPETGSERKLYDVPTTSPIRKAPSLPSFYARLSEMPGSRLVPNHKLAIA
ncbi:hypothetical protein KM043_008704 [Ampulex compressa]|nr:hypothetical protein KM043_008704 [Ampulex compressa]